MVLHAPIDETASDLAERNGSTVSLYGTVMEIPEMPISLPRFSTDSIESAGMGT
jgi:hypothetical protein